MATSVLTHEESAVATDARAGKYLVFHLGNEEFAIQVEKVREIMGVQDITQVPQTPDHVKGVINLRGKVTPVVDLRLKFSMPEIAYNQRTCIVVVQVASARGTMLVGLVVDGVVEVLQVASSDIEDTPSFGKDVEIPYIIGLAKIKNKVKILLDIEQVMSSRELAHLDVVTV